MSMVWVEGFETHRQATQVALKYASVSGSYAYPAGRVFGFAGGPSSAIAVTPSLGVDNTFIIGFGFILTSHSANLSSAALNGFYAELGPDEQCHLGIESGSGVGVRFVLKRGSTTIATSSYFDFNVWHYFELKVTVRTGTNGAYEFRHNGVPDMSGSSVDLADTGGDGWDIFAWRFASNFSTILRMDDIVVMNGAGGVNDDFLGPQVVQGILPNADGATTAWTQDGSGAHYTSVDDVGTSAPDNTGVGGTVSSDTNGQKELFGFEDLTEITGAINGVFVCAQLAMAAAGTRTVKVRYRDPDTTEADGATHTVDSTTYDDFTHCFDVNPTSAAAWDIADIDDGQFGLEVVS